jgi:hypothetical protein
VFVAHILNKINVNLERIDQAFNMPAEWDEGLVIFDCETHRANLRTLNQFGFDFKAVMIREK